MRNPAEQNPIPPLIFGALFIIGATSVGFGLVGAPGTVIPLTVQFVGLLGLTAILLQLLESDGRLRGWLWKVVGIALLVRFLALVAVHFALDPLFFAPDAWFYGRLGEMLAAYWQGEGPYPQYLAVNPQWLYPYINGVFHLAFGSGHLAAAVLNIFAATWTVIVAYYLGRDVMGEQVGKVAALLVALFPSLVLWSVLNIRDALATFLVTFIVWLAVRVYRRFDLRTVVAVIALLWVMGTIRDYMGLLLLAGMGLGFAAALRPGRVGSTLAAGAVLSLVIIMASEQLGLVRFSTLDSPLESMDQMRRALQHGATSAYGEGYDTSTFGGMLRYLPVGMAYFLLAPFPWGIETTLQATAVPETLVWYALLPLTVMGMRYGVTRGASQNVLLLGVVTVVLVSYALVEGNFGTAYRHRAQIMPVIFVFTAAGLILIRHRWAERKRSSGKRMQIPLNAVPPHPSASALRRDRS